MRKEQLFSCKDIRWEKIEELFAEMSKEKPPVKPSEGLLPPELAVIDYHVKKCEQCRKTLVGLVKRYGITEGMIFSKKPRKEKNK